MQVRACRAQSASPVDRAVEFREAFLLVAVHVRRQLVARLQDGPKEGAEEGRGRRTALEHDRPIAAAPFVGAGEARLHPLEVRETARVIPLLEAGLVRPALVVERVAAL